MDMLWIVATLFLFGWLYDAFVSWLHRAGRERGVTALLVVGGTLVTLGVVWLAVTGRTMTGDAVMVWVLAGFGASGVPMVVGSWKRYTDARRQDEQEAHLLAERLIGLTDDAEADR